MWTVPVETNTVSLLFALINEMIPRTDKLYSRFKLAGSVQRQPM